MPPGQFVVAGGHRLHYYRAGSGDVVLFLHGFGGNGTNWSAQFPALQSQFTVIALDQLGFGKSAKPHVRYDADVLATSAIHFLDALHIRRATVVGASMGGEIAARVAAEYPERVTRLVLMDASGNGEASDPHPPDIPRDPTTMAEQEALLRVLFYDQTRITPQLVRQRLESHLESHDSWTRRHFGGTEAGLHALLPKITAPTLLIWGEHDPLVPLVAACRFRRDIAHSTLVVVPAAAHVPQMEQPEIFNKTLIDFLLDHSIADHHCPL